VELIVPIESRVRHLMSEYAHLIANPAELQSLLHMLARHQPVRRLHAWDALIAAQDWPALVRSLIETHYDPAYGHSRGRMFPNVRTSLEMPDLSEESQDEFADQLLSMDFAESSALLSR
jgi:tRNA 2-selenouridine synthase